MTMFAFKSKDCCATIQLQHCRLFLLPSKLQLFPVLITFMNIDNVISFTASATRKYRASISKTPNSVVPKSTGRRTSLPAVCPDNSHVGLMAILYNNIGKDLLRSHTTLYCHSNYFWHTTDFLSFLCGSSSGKDLARVSMPAALNEPVNLLQRLCEELEYSELLDTANNTPDPYQRMVNVFKNTFVLERWETVILLIRL